MRHSRHRRAICHAKRLRKLLFKAYFSCANPSLEQQEIQLELRFIIRIHHKDTDWIIQYNFSISADQYNLDAPDISPCIQSLTLAFP